MEVCPDTGAVHLQGYIQFKSAVRLPQAKRLMDSPDVHLEPRRGTIDEAIAYTSKVDTSIPGTHVEYGDRPLGKGVNPDFTEVVESLVSGSSIRAVGVEWPLVYVRHHRGLAALHGILHPAAPRPTVRVFVLHGPTGSGKSRCVQRCYPWAYWWPIPQNSGAYAAGYTGERVCVFDDFHGWVPFHLLLRICDRYPLTVNTQGSSTGFHASLIVFTTNRHPREWYDRTKIHYPALERRMHVISRDNFDTLDLMCEETLAADRRESPRTTRCNSYPCSEPSIHH